MKNSKLKLQGTVKDYIRLTPDAPKAGSFEVEGYINETAIIDAVGPECSAEYKKLKGKRVIFNAWACDEKTLEGKKIYYAPESANAICEVVS